MKSARTLARRFAIERISSKLAPGNTLRAIVCVSPAFKVNLALPPVIEHLQDIVALAGWLQRPAVDNHTVALLEPLIVRPKQTDWTCRSPNSKVRSARIKSLSS